MRPSGKKITDYKEIEAIMGKAAVCRLALADGHNPYSSEYRGK
jgi:nitroimidazol reductase NimA-like FMN-containing flavoprotein (pyridoxamine 5'-phosphate oxidase superfamily)